jgi:HlyD family secretion protein
MDLSKEDRAVYHNSEEINEIITSVPSWILRYGITLILSVIFLIILMSALISYPDVVKTSLKINSSNSPKGIIAHQSGKLVKLLVKDNQQVKNGQTLAFIESTANHFDVIMLKEKLNSFNKNLIADLENNRNYLSINNLNLGELQSSYQTFYQEYLQFINTLDGGFYQKQKTFLQRDLIEIKKLENQIIEQKKIQQQEYANAEEEYAAYKKLKNKNVISNSEFKQQENKYLSSKYPLQQSSTALLTNNNTYLAKQKEIAILDNTIKEQQAKFIQVLNSMINEVDSWLKKYVISSPFAGKVGYVGILQENQNVTANQELFIVNPGDSNFFGEVQIPQYNMGKVNIGQRTLIKLRSYPFEEYGAINGKISLISDVALKDSIFFAKVDFEKFTQKDPKHPVILKTGMVADAEIITREGSLLQRFLRTIIKVVE